VDLFAKPAFRSNAVAIADDQHSDEQLRAIPETERKPEKEFWDSFHRHHTLILGALLDSVVTGLKRLPTTNLASHPRMADFAKWGVACESAPGAFEAAYSGNRSDAITNVIEADPISSSVREMMEQRTVWTGTAKDLLGALGEVAGEVIRKSKGWPTTPEALPGRIRRGATFLRKIGINVEFDREKRRKRRRLIKITRAVEVGISPSTPAENPQESAVSAADGVDGMRTVGRYADDNSPIPSAEKWWKTTTSDGVDGMDAKIPTPTVDDADDARLEQEGDAWTF
jgi:hypothetical protein